MLLDILHSKILRAEVTDAQLHYEGSLAIDTEIMDMIGMLPNEKFSSGTFRTDTASKPTRFPRLPAPANFASTAPSRTSEKSATSSSSCRSRA